MIRHTRKNEIHRHRVTVRVCAVLAALGMAWGCGGDSPATPPPPESARPTTLTVSPAAVELTALGATSQLTAEVRDQNARVMAGVSVAWSNNATSVATVSASGLVTAVVEGTATITASAGPASASAVVTVAQSVASVEVSPSEGTVVAGDTQQLAVEAFDANGHAVAGAEFSWESSDTSVATVDAAGLVNAVAPGEADITATSAAVTGTARLQVTGFTLSGTVGDGRREGLAVPGATVRLEAESTEPVTTDADGRYRLSDIAGSVRVTVSADPGYVEQTAEVTVESDRALDFVLEHTGEAPYPGTVWVTPDILGPSDPTSLGSVTYMGRGMRDVFDRRAEMWVTVDAYLFETRFGERTVEFQVNPEFGSREAARAQVDVFAPAIGRLPAVLMSNVGEVEINAGEGLFGGSSHAGSLLIHTEDYGTQLALREGFLEEVLMHEAAHTSLDPWHLDTPGWHAAQQADRAFISEYAQDYPDREDVAESILPYFAVRYRPHRLTTAQRWLMTMTVPNRLAYFDDQEFDMSPYTPAEPIAPTPETEPIRPLSQILQRFEEPPITRP